MGTTEAGRAGFSETLKRGVALLNALHTGSPEGKGRLQSYRENRKLRCRHGLRQQELERNSPTPENTGNRPWHCRCVLPKDLSVPYSPSQTNLEEKPSTSPGIFSGTDRSLTGRQTRKAAKQQTSGLFLTLITQHKSLAGFPPTGSHPSG